MNRSSPPFLCGLSPRIDSMFVARRKESGLSKPNSFLRTCAYAYFFRYCKHLSFFYIYLQYFHAFLFKKIYFVSPLNQSLNEKIFF